MTKMDMKEAIGFPEGVSATVEDGLLTINGEKGELKRDIFHPKIKASVSGNQLVVEAVKGTQSEKKMIFTLLAHAKNMIKGVTEGITYKLKICASHFPMSVTYKDNKLEVKNFIGEKTSRILSISPEVEVKVEGDVINLSGTSKELVGQTAGSIEKLTKRTGFDKRIFQDGIYITKKAKR